MPDLAAQSERVKLTWQQVEDMSIDLSNKLEQGGVNPDALVVLQRGGAFTGNIVARRLGLMANNVFSASLTSYKTGSQKRAVGFSVGQFPSVADLTDRSIVVVDEVCETGHTLRHTAELMDSFGALSVVSAVLHYKPAASETGFVPDYYIEETNAWIDYPWEEHDDYYRLASARSDVRAALTEQE